MPRQYPAMHAAMSFILSVRLASTAVGVGAAVLSIPQVPGDDAAVLDPAPVSFGYPFATLEGYFPGMPLTMKCMNTFRSLNTVWPNIRVGGTSEDYGIVDPELDIPKIFTGTAPTGQAKTTFGPLLMRLVAQYEGTIVWGLNRGYNNISNTIAAAKAAVREIPNLYALEVGNEPDVFAAIGQPIAETVDEWTPKTEAECESEWQIAIGTALDQEAIIQAASYYQTPDLGWGAQGYFEYANETADKYIRVFSHHNYPQSAIQSVHEPPDLKALMSHINITKNIGLYTEDVKAARARGFDYVFGETNSVSGNGEPGQGSTFGTGMWALDYTLRAVSIGIKRIYFHQGTPGKSYYVWFNDVGIRSPFYGGYVAAEALANGASIVPLDDGTTNYAGYAVYDSTGAAKKVVLINSDLFEGNGARSEHTFSVGGVSGTSLKAKRLTATNGLSRQEEGDAPTYAGRSVSDESCEFEGDEVVETLEIVVGRVNVTLAASEALLITL